VINAFHADLDQNRVCKYKFSIIYKYIEPEKYDYHCEIIQWTSWYLLIQRKSVSLINSGIMWDLVYSQNSTR